MQVKRIAANMAAAAGLALGMTAQGAIVSWTNGVDIYGAWSDGSNWSSPLPPAPGDIALIGNLAGIANRYARMDQHVTNLAALQVTDGMTVLTNGYNLLMSGADVLISGENLVSIVRYRSSVVVEAGPSPVEFHAEDVFVELGAEFAIDPGAVAVASTMTIDAESRLYAAGSLILTSDGAARSFSLDGHLQVKPEGFAISQNGDSPIDLDGIAGDGYISLGALNAAGPAVDFLINGTALHDAFDGRMLIAGSNRVEMNLAQGWTIGANGSVALAGPDDSGLGGPAVLAGSPVTIYGELENSATTGQVDAEATIQPGADVLVGANHSLTFLQPATVNGGTFFVGDAGELAFAATSTIHNADFVLEGGSITGQTIYNDDSGSISGHGTITSRIINRTSVSAVGGTLHLNNGFNTWDGGAGYTGWLRAVDGDLHLQGFLAPPFHGVMRTGVGREIFIEGISFTMEPSSVIELNGGTIRSGSLQRFGGTVEVAAQAHLETDAEFQSTAAVTLAGADLHLFDSTKIQPGATFSGAGDLVNRSSGTLILEDGAVVGADVLSTGVIRMGAFAAAEATVSGNLTAGGSVDFALAGAASGQYDRLVVSQTLQLANTEIDVTLSGYVPQVGDEFDLLDWGSLAESAFILNLPVLPAGRFWDDSDFQSEGVVRVSDRPICFCEFTGDGPGNVDVFDLLAFLDLWFIYDYGADVDTNGAINVFDLLRFLDCWFASTSGNGCH